MPLFQACTNCGSQIHVRKLTCPCGHVFRGSKPLTVRSSSRKSDVSTTRALETEKQTAKRRLRIVEYEDVKSIAMCWEGSETHPIEDLQNVKKPPVNAAVAEEASCITLHNPKIAAVFKLETFFKCLRCGSRTEPAKGNEVRCCNRDCGILNNATFCDKFSSAEVLVVEGQRKIPLYIRNFSQ